MLVFWAAPRQEPRNDTYMASAAGGVDVAGSHLAFGCRSKHADFYYAELWQQLVQQGLLANESGLITAFSRDQKQKIYVQDQLRKHSQLIWRQLEQVCQLLLHHRQRSFVCMTSCGC